MSACDHRGEHQHFSESVWLPDVARMGLRVSVKCLKCNEQLRFDPTAPIFRVRTTDGGHKLLVLFK